MKVALLGPLVKDKITVDRATSVRIGGIPYYQAIALKSLGSDASVFATYAPEDDAWIRRHFKNIEVAHIPAERTIEFERMYSSANPDACVSVETRYAKNNIGPSPELINRLNSFDYVIFGPLFHDNISPALFASVKKEKNILGNFGMFTYPASGGLVWKNPENLLHIAPYLSYIFLDDREIMFVAQKKSIDEAVKFLQTKTNATIVVTRGSRGSIVFSDGGRFVAPAFPPKKICDSTGAGDTYAAAFVRALKLYKNSASQGTFAAMAATMKLERRGAFGGEVRDVLSRLAERGIVLS